MKFFIFQCFIILFASCGSPEQSANSNKSTMSFSLDTVLVDPTGDILYLNWNLSQSFLSNDHRYLFNFNRFDYTLEKIDLDNLVLVEKLPIEKEGPNGVGENVHTILPINSESVYFGKYNGIGGVFSLEGKKLMDLPLNEFGDLFSQVSSNEQLSSIKFFSTNSNVFYGLITAFDRDEYELAKIDISSNIFSRIQLPLMDRIRPFKVTFRDGPSRSSVSPSIYLVTEGSKVIAGTGVSNELYVLDRVVDTLHYHAYESKIMPHEKSGKYQNEVSSEEQMNAVYRTINEEISYGAPFWDDEKELYYRFSSLGEYIPDSGKPNYDLTPDKFKVFLTLYDKNLDQINESLIPMLDKVPSSYFVKDGKIWIFENIEDEMGFFRLNIDL